MTKRELHRQIAGRTGDDLRTINRLGFSVLEESAPDQPDEWETQSVDWDEEAAYPRSQWFRHRRQHRSEV